jgi:hypothetical protein
MKRVNIRIGIFVGATTDILQVDLSFLNLKFIKLYSDSFMDIIKGFNKNLEIQKKNLSPFEDWKKDKFNYHIEEKTYALIPINMSHEVNGNHPRLIEKIMLIMFPSDFRMFSYIEYSNYLYEPHEIHLSTIAIPNYITSQNRGIKEGWLSFPSSEISDINFFIRHFIEKQDRLGCLEIALNSYIQSFKQTPIQSSFISLFIALESLVQESFEITHQISRYCAVINSTSIEVGNTIYKNLKKLYGLRSKIIHGNQYDLTKLHNDLYFKLEAVVSRTLIELVSHEIFDVKSLGKRVNELGFGEKGKLSDSYLSFNINHTTKKLIELPIA